MFIKSATLEGTALFAIARRFVSTYTLFVLCVAVVLLAAEGRAVFAEFMAFALTCSSAMHAILANYATARGAVSVGHSGANRRIRRLEQRVVQLKLNAAAVVLILAALFFFLDYKVQFSGSLLWAVGLAQLAFMLSPFVVRLLIDNAAAAGARHVYLSAAAFILLWASWIAALAFVGYALTRSV